jgi:hypothetical protein
MAMKLHVLSSDRKDVVDLYGIPAESDFPYMVKYLAPHVRMTIHYSRGTCESTRQKDGWDVPEFTVTRIFLFLQVPKGRKALPFSTKSGFRRYRIPGSVNAWAYENDQLGRIFVLNSKGLLESISFYPSDAENGKYCGTVLSATD